MTTPLAIAPDPLATLPPIVRWLMERSKPEEPALELVTPTATLDSLYAAWMKEKYYASAIRLIASVLPAREGIWWAWVSARHATQMPGGTAPTKEVHAALGNIERWIIRPDDETRRTVWDSANAAGLDTPAGVVGSAVFLSGVSIGPVDTAPIPPPPDAALPLISGGILLASASNSDAKQIEPTQIGFAAQGLEVVKRLGGWDAALKAAHDNSVRAKQDYERATKSPEAR